jgi:hypothetical protein
LQLQYRARAQVLGPALPVEAKRAAVSTTGAFVLAASGARAFRSGWSCRVRSRPPCPTQV